MEKLAGTKCKLRKIAEGGPQGFPNGNESGIVDNSSDSKPEKRWNAVAKQLVATGVRMTCERKSSLCHKDVSEARKGAKLEKMRIGRFQIIKVLPKESMKRNIYSKALCSSEIKKVNFISNFYPKD